MAAYLKGTRDHILVNINISSQIRPTVDTQDNSQVTVDSADQIQTTIDTVEEE